MLRKAVVLGSLDQTSFLSPWHMLELSQVTRLRVVQGHEDGSGCGWVQPPQVEPPAKKQATSLPAQWHCLQGP